MNYSLLKVAGLKEQLKKLKLPVSGTKAELLARLESFHGKSDVKPDKSSTSSTSSGTKKKKVTNQQNVNIYVGSTGQVEKADEGKNIYISSGVRASPFLPSGNNPSIQSTSGVKHPVVIPASIVKYTGVPKPSSSSSSAPSSSSSSAPIGEEEEKQIEKILPKKLVLSKKFTEKLQNILGANVPTTQQALVQSMPQTTIAMPIPNVPPPPPMSEVVPKKND